jgi:hypothetical protein
MTKSLVVPSTESTTNAPTSHEQLTIPLCSGGFAATTAWVRYIWMDDCLRVVFFSVHSSSLLNLFLVSFYPAMLLLLLLLLLQGVGYPADIIKTRIQASSSNKGIYQTGVELLAEANGNIIGGLYRGFGLKLVRSVPASMIGFTAYEFVAARLR